MKIKFMKSFGITTILLFMMATLLLSACSDQEAASVEESATETKTEAPESDDAAETEAESSDTSEEAAMEEAAIEEPAIEEPAMDEEITIVMWNWSQEQEEFYDRVAAAFKEEYPNVTVDWQTRALPQHNEALPLAFQSDESPDLFFYDGITAMTRLSELLELGWVQPLVNMPEDWMDRWPEGAFAEGITHVGDDLYSFGQQDRKIWGGGFLFFNKDIIEEAGLDPDNPPKTRSEFLEACQTITENTSAFCLSNPMQPASELSRLWNGLAGAAYTNELFDYQQGRYNIDDPRLIESFEYIQTLYENDYVLPGVYDKATARAAMGTGQVAFYMGGAWMPSVFNGMGFDNENLGMALAFTPDEGRTGSQIENPFHSIRVFLSSQSEHPEEASAFVEFLTRPDGYFAQGYINEGFGTLQYADLSNIEDPYLAALAEMATDPANDSFRAIHPQPILKCPEVATSTAQLEADQIRPGWEWEEMQLALVEGKDFAPIAAEIAATKNERFQAVLSEEGTSADCFTFPDYDYVSDFTPDMYNNSEEAAMEEAPMEEAAMDEEITIVMWNWSQEQEEFYDRVAAAFKEEYPNVTVDWQTRALPQHNEALPLAFQSDESPDLFFYDGITAMTRLSELLELGWVQPLVNMPEDWMDRWPEGAFAEGITHVGDDLYSFGQQDRKIWGGGFLFFNKEIIEEAGLDPDNPPKTRSEFLEACQTITENTSAFCLSNPMQPASELSRLWNGLAGAAYTNELFDYQQGRYNIDDPRLIESFEYIQTLYENDYVLPGVYDKATARAAMGTGQAAFYMGGAWMPSVFNGMGFDNENLGMALAFTPDEGRTGSQIENPFHSIRVFLSSQSEHPEEASAFVEFLTRPDGYFAQGYVNEGFGTLQYADLSNLQDPYLAALAEMATDPANDSFRAIHPQPILKCPEVATSTAQLEADQIRPGWEWEEMQLALVEGKDFAPIAAEIAAAKNERFQEVLAEEGTSADCFTFPDYDYISDFTPDMYIE